MVSSQAMSFSAIVDAFLTPPLHLVRDFPAGRVPEPICLRLRLPEVPLRSLPPRGRPEYYGAGAEIAVYAWGAAERPAALLVHGWGGWAAQWSAWVAPLLSAGLRVVAFDAPGHGRSEGTYASAPAFAGAIRALADRTPGGFRLLVGHSLGAIAATLALADGVRVERAAFLAPFCQVDPLLIAQGHAMGLPPSQEEALTAYMQETFGHDISLPGAIRRAGALPPLTVLHDPDDLEVPFSEAREAAAEWPGAVLVSLPRVGHQRILLSKAALQRVLDDLAG